MSRSTPQKKAESIAALNFEFRELSTATIMLHEAVADRLQMNATDHKCAGILAQAGSITAGELAERTGLTSGAITGVVDRLERAGFVRRLRDSVDRRRVILAPDLDQIERKIGPLFESIARATAELCSGYTEAELSLIRDFTARCRALAEEETRKLREGPAGQTTRK